MMRKTNLAKALTLSLMLTGAATWYTMPLAQAADPDQVGTVATGGGTYNSITATEANSTRVSDYIYGVYNGTSSAFTITMTGDKTISVTDNGKTGTQDRSAYAFGVLGATINANSTKDSLLTIEVEAKAGKIPEEGTEDNNCAKANAYGIANSKVGDYVYIKVSGVGGESRGTSAAEVDSSVTTIGADNSELGNNIQIDVSNTGGEASGSFSATQLATAYGARNSEVGNKASIKVVAKNASPGGDGYAEAYAYGSQGSVIGNDAMIDVHIEAQEESSAESSAEAYGVNMGQLGNNAKISVCAEGSTNSLKAPAKAYGLHAVTVGKNATIDVEAIGGKFMGSTGFTLRNPAMAVGGYAAAQGEMTKFLGAAKITAKASSLTAGSGFYAYGLYAKDSGVNDMTVSGISHQLEGDIHAESGGVNKLTLDTEDSYLQGNITNKANATGQNIVTIGNGATWRPVYDNRYGTDCNEDQTVSDKVKNVATNKVAERTVSASDTINLNKDGIIDLTWDGWNNGTYDTKRTYRSEDNSRFRKMTIGNLAGSEGKLKVDSDLANNKADVLTVGSASTATSLKVQVNYDDFYDSSAANVVGKALVVNDESGKLTVSSAPSQYNEKTYEITVEQDSSDSNKWNLVKIVDVNGQDPTPTPTPSTHIITENTYHAADARANVNNIWLVEINSLTKRLGDLRSMGKVGDNDNTKYDNIWAKYGHGIQNIGTSRDTELQYNQFQIGYDKAFAKKNGKVYRGIMVSRINGDATYERGSGDTNSTALGLYQTWLGDKGHYYDIVLKAGKISTDYNVTDLSDNYSDGDYDMWATAMSGEYGYRRVLNNGAYIEPNAEFILSHVGSAGYTTSKNMDVYLDATKHAIAKVGFNLGKEFDKGDAYIKANYYHDFAGGGSVTTGTVRYEADHAKNWWEFALGGNVRLTKNASAYAEVKKYFGNIHSNVTYSVGARWTF